MKNDYMVMKSAGGGGRREKKPRQQNLGLSRVEDEDTLF